MNSRIDQLTAAAGGLLPVDALLLAEINPDDPGTRTHRKLAAANLPRRLGTTGVLADDAAVSFELNDGSPSGPVAILLFGNAPQFGSALLWARADGTIQAVVGNNFGSVPEVSPVAGNGALTGTTGPDGTLNVRTDSAGNFYVENRIGVAAVWTVWVLS